ncbi:hypothetical protein [Brachyspira aalborgi]|uniref:hypothetical protein n=1 Tax=Brachyspira aalborgi TaxID=29522 RepID=UPI00266BD814|nr:hypothetical protein [Brachyspira aalborgi]
MSKSYRKNPIHWVCGNTSKKDKQAYNRCMRHNNKLILKDYDDGTVLQVHKRDGLSWWDWTCDGKIHFFYTKKELLNNEELALWYKKLMRK